MSDSIFKCRKCCVYTEKSVHCGVEASLVIDGARRVKLSKLISGTLRHFPERLGLKLDREGFVGIEELVKAIKSNKKSYSWLNSEHVIALAMLDPKGRFEIKNGKIRARYGHSIKVRINYIGDREVKILYHGTTKERLKDILSRGLRPMKRLKVHLTSSIEEAWQNARRWNRRPVVIVVDADALRNKGMKILKAGKYTYLVDKVPVDCITKILEG